MQLLLSRIVPILVTLSIFIGIYRLSNFKDIASRKLKITTTVKAFIYVFVSAVIFYSIIVMGVRFAGINIKNYGGLVNAIVVGYILATFHELTESDKGN